MSVIDAILFKSHSVLFLFNNLDCTPSKIWLLIRHGTRLPTAKGIKRFSEMEKVINYKINLPDRIVKIVVETRK